MPQPRLLADLAREGLDLERRGVGVGQHGSDDPDLDLPVGMFSFTVSGERFTTLPVAVSTSSAQLVRQLEGVLARLVWVEDQLHQPRAVAQVDEDQSAVIAAAVHQPATRSSESTRSGSTRPHQVSRYSLGLSAGNSSPMVGRQSVS